MMRLMQWVVALVRWLLAQLVLVTWVSCPVVCLILGAGQCAYGCWYHSPFHVAVGWLIFFGGVRAWGAKENLAATTGNQVDHAATDG